MNADTRNAPHRMAAQKFPRDEHARTGRARPVGVGTDDREGRLPSGVEPLLPVPRPDTGSWPRRLVPVAAAAAAVLAVGGVGTWWAAGSGSPAVQPAATSAVGAATTTESPSRTTQPPSTPASPSRPAGRYLPPQTPAALKATLSRILAGAATVRVTDTSSAGASAPSQTPAPPVVQGPGDSPATTRPATPPAPVPAPVQPKPTPDDGAAIVGTITSSDGVSGGFALDVFAGAQPDAFGCTSDFTECTVTARPDGSSLAVGLAHDGSVPGGITYEVHLVRPDGGNILLYLSNEADPKGQSGVLADHAPLTLAQMTDLVASDQW